MLRRTDRGAACSERCTVVQCSTHHKSSLPTLEGGLKGVTNVSMIGVLECKTRPIIVESKVEKVPKLTETNRWFFGQINWVFNTCAMTGLFTQHEVGVTGTVPKSSSQT